MKLIPPKHLTYMPGIGIDLTRYDPGEVTTEQIRALKRELGIGPDDRILLMVAEFIPRKRHRDALSALRKLNRPGVHLLLAGDGPLMAEMKELAARWGLGSRVHFLGFGDDIPVLVRSAAAVLLPSMREGLPRAILEAMSLETPVIASRIRGAEELLEGDRGLLFPVGDVDALAGQMAWILDHPEEARAIAGRARRRVAAYDIRPILTMHEQLYERALQRTR